MIGAIVVVTLIAVWAYIVYRFASNTNFAELKGVIQNT